MWSFFYLMTYMPKISGDHGLVNLVLKISMSPALSLLHHPSPSTPATSFFSGEETQPPGRIRAPWGRI